MQQTWHVTVTDEGGYVAEFTFVYRGFMSRIGMELANAFDSVPELREIPVYKRKGVKYQITVTVND